MSQSRITISDHEWLSVANLLGAVYGPYVKYHPTLNRACSTGPLDYHHWAFRGPDNAVVVTEHHGIQGGNLNVTVDANLIYHAANLVCDNMSVELLVCGDYLEVRTENGTGGIFDKESYLPISPKIPTGELATAVIRQGDLRRALWAATRPPCRLPRAGYRPPLQIGIGTNNGFVQFSSDWNPYAERQATFDEPARTSTGTAIAGINPYSIGCLIPSTADQYTEIRISIEADHVCFEVLDADGWRAYVPRVPTGAVRWAEDVKEMLTDANLEWTNEGSGQIAVTEWGEPAITISFHDTRPETLRLKLLIAEDLDESTRAALLEQVNSLNIAKVGVGFLAPPGGLAFAYLDLPCRQLGCLLSALPLLRRETEGLGILFHSI